MPVTHLRRFYNNFPRPLHFFILHISRFLGNSLNSQIKLNHNNMCDLELSVSGIQWQELSQIRLGNVAT